MKIYIIWLIGVIAWNFGVPRLGVAVLLELDLLHGIHWILVFSRRWSIIARGSTLPNPMYFFLRAMIASSPAPITISSRAPAQTPR